MVLFHLSIYSPRSRLLLMVDLPPGAQANEKDHSKLLPHHIDIPLRITVGVMVGCFISLRVNYQIVEKGLPTNID